MKKWKISSNEYQPTLSLEIDEIMSKVLRTNLITLGFFLFVVKISAQLTKTESVLPKDLQVPYLKSMSITKGNLRIGDQVPEIKFIELGNSKQTINLSDFRGKWVLLDFWATWCFPCVNSFPKLDTLQRKYSRDLKILLVNSKETGDDKEKIERTIKNIENKRKQQLALQVTIEDSIASALFPHLVIPHCVWISPNGIVQAITSGDQVNENNINKGLNGEALNLPIKKDFFPDKLMALEANDELVINKNLLFYSALKKGQIEGLPPINENRFLKIQNGDGLIFRGLAMRNLPLLEIYEKAISFNKEYGALNRKRIILNVEKPEQLSFQNLASKSKQNWEKENLYTYDLILPELRPANIYETIIHYLNISTGFYGRLERRFTDCLQLIVSDESKLKQFENKKDASESSIFEDGNYILKNAPSYLIVNILNNQPQVSLPVLNKVKKEIKINIKMDVERFDLTKIRKSLSEFGLDLIETKEQLMMFVITDYNK